MRDTTVGSLALPRLRPFELLLGALGIDFKLNLVQKYYFDSICLQLYRSVPPQRPGAMAKTPR